MGTCSINNGNLTIIDSSFINTTAHSEGAVYEYISNIKIINCDFKNSEVNWSTIFLSYSEAIIENSRFST